MTLLLINNTFNITTKTLLVKINHLYLLFINDVRWNTVQSIHLDSNEMCIDRDEN